jgi:putative acetyltransferase
MLHILPATTPDHFTQISSLLAELSAWDKQMTASLGFDVTLLDYQYNPAMLDLPGEFVPPDGCLLLAQWEDQAAGCIAFHKFAPGVCELKRMYVRPQFRGRRVARTLVETLIAQARQVGYSTMLLETVTFMQEAHRLYYSFGFQAVEPYYQIPEAFLPITLFMRLDL